jgi:hypothetical protein
MQSTTTKLVKERKGLASIRDRDGDGISDYDEETLYNTDPNNPFTGSSVLTDGERVLLGLDPRKADLEPVVVESPYERKAEIDNLYFVDEIEPLVSTTSEGAPEVLGVRRIKGRAQPLAFVTLYVYSTPIIVTVQADSAGTFDYIFDQTLEDGSHEIFVASVNNSGKIVAQSSPIPFVKTAQAIEYTPATVTGASPVDKTTQYMLIITLVTLLLIALTVVVWIGMHHTHPDEEEIGVPQP